jgi:chaperonin GroES
MEEEFMKLKPMADNVLLKQFEAPETTVSGIILATATKEKPAIYEVVSAGPGTKEVTMTVAAGDRVVVAKNVGFDVTIDKVDYKFVKLEEILATVTD